MLLHYRHQTHDMDDDDDMKFVFSLSHYPPDHEDGRTCIGNNNNHDKSCRRSQAEEVIPVVDGRMTMKTKTLVLDVPRIRRLQRTMRLKYYCTNMAIRLILLHLQMMNFNINQKLLNATLMDHGNFVSSWDYDNLLLLLLPPSLRMMMTMIAVTTRTRTTTITMVNHHCSKS